MSVTVQPGTYDGVVKAAAIYEAPSGAVMCSMEVEVEGSVLKGGICLVQKDGTLSERGFRDVQAVFGWSDWDWDRWGKTPDTFAGAAVQAVIETTQGDRGEFSSLKYINPPGGQASRLETGNVKDLAAKYGAKARALLGGTAAPTTRKPPKPPAAPPKPSGKASTMEECWDEFCKQAGNVTKSEAELYDEWHSMIRKVAGKGQNDLTPEDWGKVFNTFDGLKM